MSALNDALPLLVLVFSAGGAWAGVRWEVRRLSREVKTIRQAVRRCPHHANDPITQE